MSEILGKNSEELKSLKIDIAKDIFNLRNEKKISQRLEKPHLISKKRRDIARIETALKQFSLHPESIEEINKSAENRKVEREKKVSKKKEDIDA